jgi:hypothetical protein
MPTDIAALGIAVDTRGVSAADIALDRLAKAAQDATAAVQRMTAAATANSTQAGSLAKQATTAAAAHNTLAVAATRATAAHHAHGAAAGLNRMAMMEYEHSIRSVIDGLSAGMSPMRLFAMEGARLAQAYQMGGGASGALQMFGGTVSKLMSPTVALTGAVVALGAGGIYAFDAWQQRLNALQGALNGLGRSTGLTLGGLSQLATQSAGGRTSSLQAMDAITAFTATGRITPEMQQRLVAPQSGQSDGLVQQYSRATGASFSESVKTLAADFSSPTEGAKKLNEQFGFLGDNEMQLIMHLDAGGQRLAAQGRLLDDLRGRIQGAADVTSIWTRGWEAVAAAASSAVAAAGRFVSPPTPEDALAAIRAKNLAAGPGQSDLPGYGLLQRRPIEQRNVLQEQTLQEMVDRRSNSAVLAAMDQTAKEKSRDIGDIFRRTNPDIDRLSRLTDDRDKLQAAMDTPGALGKTDRNAAQEALDRLNARVKNFGTTAQIVARDSAAASAATMATTATQRTAIEAFKAWSDVVREGGGYALAAAESTARWNEALADTQHRLDDESRNAAHTLETSTMRPYQRRQAEIAFEAANFTRDSVYAPRGVYSAPGGIGAPSYAPAQNAAPGGSVSAPAPVGGFSAPNPNAYPVSQAGQAAFIRDYAAFAGGGRGLNPAVALGVANAEGLRAITPQNPNGGSTIDRNPDGTPFSFGAFQLNVRNGLGNTARAAGIDPADPAQANLANRFAMDQMATGGLGPWRGDAYVKSMSGGFGGVAPARGPSGPYSAAPSSGIVIPQGAAPNPAQHAASTAQLQQAASNEAVLGPQRDAQDALIAQFQLLKVQKDTWAQTAGAIAEATERVKLMNEETAKGIPITQAIQIANDKLAKQTGAQVQNQSNFQMQTDQINQLNDGLRSFSNSSLGDIFTDFSQSTTKQDILGQLTRGQQNAYYTGHTSLNQAKWEATQRQIQSLASRSLINAGVGELTKGFLGSGSVGSTGYQPGLLGGVLNGALGGLGGLFGPGGGAVLPGGAPLGLGGIGMNAKGGVFGPGGFVPLRSYAGGGIANSPQAAIFGEGKDPEAFVPLADGRSIPVTMKAPKFGGAQGTTVTQQHNWNVQSGDIIVQGNADEKAINQMRGEMAANNAVLTKQITRNLGQIQNKNASLYGG